MGSIHRLVSMCARVMRGIVLCLLGWVAPLGCFLFDVALVALFRVLLMHGWLLRCIFACDAFCTGNGNVKVRTSF